METTIGGDRLGSGSKQTTSFRNYERSTHDLGYVWRSSMASGTLVPFMSKVALPGDKWNIKLNCDVMTLPTIGPLFGSYKVQLDVFEVPIRLYNAKLHMNRLGIGMDMKSIFLPQIEVRAVNKIAAGLNTQFEDNEQINSSSLLKYLGISGLYSYAGATPNPLTRNFNAVPYIAYWDIYKNYYSNKQEEIGVYIHTDVAAYDLAMIPTGCAVYTIENFLKFYALDPQSGSIEIGDTIYVDFASNAVQPDPGSINCQADGPIVKLDTLAENFVWNERDKILKCTVKTDVTFFYVYKDPATGAEGAKNFFGLKTFPLENIDLFRDSILQHTGPQAFVITNTDLEPYNAPMQQVTTKAYSAEFSQEGLGIKTYQSDLFNNWISTEWIDGPEGISALTAVDTSGGNFTMDALNIASKVYDMLNRIAVSGGTYDDWLEAVYTHERVKGVENPVYCGSLIKELSFEEVVSTALTLDSTEQNRKQPLGTLAGRGRLTGKHKGGEIEISVNEPSYILGIVSLTPRVDYSQGNDWDVSLETLDDLHKPGLDGIGFQDLITEQLLWSSTRGDGAGAMTKQSLGKQPAWINYMTSVNKTFGAFAEEYNSMFMTLNRRYGKETRDGFRGQLKDGTTYIDPTKFNNVFAEVGLASQNFWVQINVDAIARRKMSAKIIPNL